MKKILTFTFATFMFLNINAQMRPSQGALFLGIGADPFSIISQSINDMDGGTFNYDVDKNTITQFNLNTEICAYANTAVFIKHKTTVHFQLRPRVRSNGVSEYFSSGGTLTSGRNSYHWKYLSYFSIIFCKIFNKNF